MMGSECPYGAEECPKLRELAKFDEEIVTLRESVASLNNTVRWMTSVLTVLLCASTGVGILI